MLRPFGGDRRARTIPAMAIITVTVAAPVSVVCRWYRDISGVILCPAITLHSSRTNKFGQMNRPRSMSEFDGARSIKNYKRKKNEKNNEQP